jgi:hypothetical protein
LGGDGDVTAANLFTFTRQKDPYLLSLHVPVMTVSQQTKEKLTALILFFLNTWNIIGD